VEETLPTMTLILLLVQLMMMKKIRLVSGPGWQALVPMLETRNGNISVAQLW